MKPTFWRKLTIALASKATGILTALAAPYEKGQALKASMAN